MTTRRWTRSRNAARAVGYRATPRAVVASGQIVVNVHITTPIKDVDGLVRALRPAVIRAVLAATGREDEIGR